MQYAGDGLAAASIYERLGEALFVERRIAEAIGPLRRAARLGSESVWPRLSEAFLERGRFLAALGAVEEADRRGSKDPRLLAVRRHAEAKLGPASGVLNDLLSGISP